MKLEWLFGKTFFSLDGDPLGGGGASLDQPEPEDKGNDNGGNGDEPADSPTEYVEFEGVKVPAAAFEKTAKERYKDAFEAKENREKWQAENTRKAQENAEKLRKAELYDQMMSDRRFQKPEPTNPYESKRKEYVEKKMRIFPDVDPRFFESQFDDIQELAEMKGRELVEPIQAEAGERFEREFLAAHPDVTRGSKEYQEIAQLMARGLDAEKAYRVVFQDSILEKQLKERTEKAIKDREADALRKLKQSRQSSGANGVQPKSKNLDERAWNIIKKFRGTE